MKFTHFLSSTLRSIGLKTRIAALVLGALFVVGWLLTRPPTESWVDMAKSHTGQAIEVHRVVKYRFGGGWQRSPTQFSLKFTNPSSGKRVSWEGEQYVRPVLLDVVNGTPWLVISSSLFNSELKGYGCPEIPYVFLSYKQGHWVSVAPSESPSELRNANILHSYEHYLIFESRIVSAEKIASDLRSKEISTAGYFNITIPRSLEQWKYGSKTAYATGRHDNDCRAPLPQPVNYIEARPSTPVELETMSSKAVEPLVHIQESPNSPESLWGNYSWDKNRALACKDRLQGADEQDQRLTGWQRFIADTTKTKIFPSYRRFCDPEAVWIFGDGIVQSGRFVVTKATNTGDILYKVSFAAPPVVLGTAGTIRYSTFNAKDGFVEFEWVSFDSGGYDWYVKHLATFRFREPGVIQPMSAVAKKQ